MSAAFLTSLIKTSVLLIDESLPAPRLQLLEIWVGDTFTLTSDATFLKFPVFFAPTPVLFCFIASIIRSDLLLSSAIMLLLLKPRARNFKKSSFELFFDLTDSVK